MEAPVFFRDVASRMFDHSATTVSAAATVKSNETVALFTREKGGAAIQICRSPLVATQHAIYQTTDIGNAETWAAVAMVAVASVVDRSSTPVVPTSVSCAMTATTISAPGVPTHCVSAQCMSAAVTTAGAVSS
jgi:hypothetical protein